MRSNSEAIRELFPPDELRTEREKVLTALSSLTAQSQVGEQLSKRYAEVLSLDVG